MKTFGKVCLYILIFAAAVKLSPLLILVLIIMFACMKGDGAKDKANKVLDKTKRIINS